MKVFKLFKKLLIFLVSMCVLIIMGGLLCTYLYAHHDQPGQSQAISGHTLISENFYTDITPNREGVAQLKGFISSLSPNVSAPFYKEWKVIISSNMPSVLIEASKQLENTTTSADNTLDFSTLGFSDWHLRVIYLRAQPEPEKAFMVFAHELGHYFDYEFGTPSETKEFQEIFLLYKDSFVEADPSSTVGYATSSPSEFFATAFKEYFLFPAHLKSVAPKAYDFISTVYTEVSNNENASITFKYDLRSVLFAVENRLIKSQEEK